MMLTYSPVLKPVFSSLFSASLEEFHVPCPPFSSLSLQTFLLAVTPHSTSLPVTESNVCCLPHGLPYSVFLASPKAISRGWCLCHHCECRSGLIENRSLAHAHSAAVLGSCKTSHPQCPPALPVWSKRLAFSHLPAIFT